MNKGKQTMIIRALYRSVVFAFISISLAGCGGGEVPADRYFRFSEPTIPIPPPPSRSAVQGIIEVPRLIARGLLNEQAIAFSTEDEPSVLRQYRTQFWGEPPGLLLQEYMVRFLQQNNAAIRVVSNSYGIRSDFTVRGEIRRMELIDASRPIALLEVELGLIQNSDDRLLFKQTYRIEQPIERATPAATVAGMNQAADKILSQFITAIRGLNL